MKHLVKHSPGTDMVAQCPVTPWPENINSEGSREQEKLISKLNWFSLLISKTLFLAWAFWNFREATRR